MVKMYDDVITMCWSIREVNRNLQDRESMTDYSIEYLKKACRDLSEMIASGKAADLEEEVEVVNRSGKAAEFKMAEVAEDAHRHQEDHRVQPHRHRRPMG